MLGRNGTMLVGSLVIPNCSIIACGTVGSRIKLAVLAY